LEKSVKNPLVDQYFLQGCGRCSLHGTPNCKVHFWTTELYELRRIALESGLTEDLKWGVATYCYEGKNVAMVSAFKDYASLSFFKGALLTDMDKILHSPGENSQAARLLRFKSPENVLELEQMIKAFIREAIELEKSGKKVEFNKNPEPVPVELEQKMEENPNLAAAFKALTPGRQRGYILFFSAPKQSATRVNRIEKMIPQILAGKGMND
jgi:uncharacterized protein YdeI (YjbR/CyaY-like superfamily)